MEVVTHSPSDGVYPAVGDYVHAIEVRRPERFVFVAGTMGLDPQGVPGASLTEQLDLIWSNIRAILASADMTVDNVVRLTSYLRDAFYAEANATARVARSAAASSPPPRSSPKPSSATGSSRSRSSPPPDQAPVNPTGQLRPVPPRPQ